MMSSSDAVEARRGERSLTYRCSTAHEAQSTNFFPLLCRRRLEMEFDWWSFRLSSFKKRIGALKQWMNSACKPSLSLHKRKGLFTEIEEWAIKTTIPWHTSDATLIMSSRFYSRNASNFVYNYCLSVQSRFFQQSFAKFSKHKLCVFLFTFFLQLNVLIFELQFASCTLGRCCLPAPVFVFPPKDFQKSSPRYVDLSVTLKIWENIADWTLFGKKECRFLSRMLQCLALRLLSSCVLHNVTVSY